MSYSEAQVLEVLARIFASNNADIQVGIGDDAAVLKVHPGELVMTTDMAVEGVHFKRSWSSANDIGHRIIAANLADLIAMGATPAHLVAAVSLTGDEPLEWIEELAIGMRDEAAKVGAVIVGGDLVRSDLITLAITAIGYTQHPILRSGAKVGDSIYISGLPGFSAAGHAALILGKSEREFARAISAFRAPDVAYEMGKQMWRANSLTDVSDGVTTQAEQMADASGVKFAFELEGFRASSDFALLESLAKECGISIWQWVLAGGEDHHFLATGKDLPGLRVGSVIAGDGVEVIGLAELPKKFEHF
jgi:thiamine-monophosphate kinase